MKQFSLIVLLFFFALPVLSQDAAQTLESQPVTIGTQETIGNTTVEDGGTVINNIEAPAPPVEQPSFLSSILEFVIGAIVGAGLALGSAAAWIKSAMNDPVKMTLAETAARNISPETLKQILEFLKTSQDFVIEATDGVPMVTKPKPIETPPASIAPSQFTNPNITNIHAAGGENIGGDAEFP